MFRMKPFRKHHLLNSLRESEKTPLPLDVFLRNYFRKHKAVGSKDRAEICATFYGIIRCKGLLDARCKKPVNWEDRIEAYSSSQHDSRQDYPPHIQVSFPKFFFTYLQEAYGEKRALELCLNSNQQAPTTVRINPLKTTRDALLKKWKPLFSVFPCKYSKLGIVFPKRMNFFALPEFKEGLFEMQDEGSQLIANHVKARPNDHILDFCAGSGGKTLGFAPLMKDKGQVYLYDVRPHALVEAKKRLKRAGIQNAQILDEEKLKKRGLLNRMDWILLDVPCSGSGTLRRNPDIKWKFTPEKLEQLIEEQRKIFDKVLKFLRHNGKIVYATCSIFPRENERQISYFMDKYQLKLSDKPFQSFPKDGEMDGFYCAVLSRIQNT
ncbi:MAG: RsmB/NOP family class I SAM-dependent RNA methyltransferase [Simkaniaceae bacterium]|nr:RsmB/NOP family class I SAM-dependent RNA methyltransferase [Simkaniaceae bacterium]